MLRLSSRTGRQFQRYNNKGGRQVVGCIPYRYKKTNQSYPFNGSLVEDLEVLLISSQKSPAFFFPKGGWEIDETVEEAASRETQEEAGVVGIVECQLGIWRFKSKSQGTFHEGFMFPLLVTEELDVWPEKNVRQRIWMKVNAARETCAHSWMKEALAVLVQRLIHQRQKEGKNPMPCSSCALEFLRTEEQRMVGPCSSCALEFLRTEEPRIVGMVSQNGEEEVDCCIVS